MSCRGQWYLQLIDFGYLFVDTCSESAWRMSPLPVLFQETQAGGSLSDPNHKLQDSTVKWYQEASVCDALHFQQQSSCIKHCRNNKKKPKPNLPSHHRASVVGVQIVPWCLCSHLICIQLIWFWLCWTFDLEQVEYSTALPGTQRQSRMFSPFKKERNSDGGTATTNVLDLERLHTCLMSTFLWFGWGGRNHKVNREQTFPVVNSWGISMVWFLI